MTPPIDAYPPIVGRIYPITKYKFNFNIFPNVYICIGYILATIICSICVLVDSYNRICDVRVPILQGPNLPHQHFPGAQFAGAQSAGAQFAGAQSAGDQFATKKRGGGQLKNHPVRRAFVTFSCNFKCNLNINFWSSMTLFGLA